MLCVCYMYTHTQHTICAEPLNLKACAPHTTHNALFECHCKYERNTLLTQHTTTHKCVNIMPNTMYHVAKTNTYLYESAQQTYGSHPYHNVDMCEHENNTDVKQYIVMHMNTQTTHTTLYATLCVSVHNMINTILHL